MGSKEVHVAKQLSRHRFSSQGTTAEPRHHRNARSCAPSGTHPPLFEQTIPAQHSSSFSHDTVSSLRYWMPGLAMHCDMPAHMAADRAVACMASVLSEHALCTVSCQLLFTMALTLQQLPCMGINSTAGCRCCMHSCMHLTNVVCSTSSKPAYQCPGRSSAAVLRGTSTARH